MRTSSPPPPKPVFILLEINDFLNVTELATTHVNHIRQPHTKLRKLK